jgi:acyl-CoA synthetase (NDP forming)
MKSGVGRLLNAKRFVVFGATNKEEKPGYVIFRNLLNAGKEVFGVNIHGGSVLGQKIFKDINEVAYQIDCAVIATPAKTVPGILRQIAKRKIENVVVISAGFGEVGNKEFEEHLGRLAKELGINLLGPNSFGFINPYEKINTSFYSGEISLGGISFISQSGAIGAGIIDKLRRFSGFVSVGNAVNLKFSDFVRYYSEDENTKVLCLYMEGLEEGEGAKFVEVCKRCKKPILVLKAGKTIDGKKAAKSHTASVASDEEIYSGVFRQAGVVECSSIREMFRAAKILEKHEVIGGEACIVTNAGGLGVLASDYLDSNKVSLMKMNDSLKRKLNKVLPDNWSHNNPIDIVGDADFARELEVFKILEKEKGFGFYIVLLTPQHMTEIKKSAKLLSMLRKPVFVCLLGGEKVKEGRMVLAKEGIPVFNDPEEMCDVVGRVVN